MANWGIIDTWTVAAKLHLETTDCSRLLFTQLPCDARTVIELVNIFLLQRRVSNCLDGTGKGTYTVKVQQCGNLL